MSNLPITYVKAKIARPASAVQQHTKIQQHLAVLMREPDFAKKTSIIAIRKSDLDRLFGVGNHPKEFYTNFGTTLGIIALREKEDSGTERFATITLLSQYVIDQIFAFDDMTLQEFLETDSEPPELRFTILQPVQQFQENELFAHLPAIDHEQFKATNVNKIWVASIFGWAQNNEPVNEELDRARIHLKDIPLTTRANRHLVRSTLEKYREQLMELYVKSSSQLSYPEWLVSNQGVDINALNDLKAIDELPDDKYVEAMVAFKKGFAQMAHSQAIKDKKTELHLFDWTKKMFGQEFNDLGREEALKDIEGLESEQSHVEHDEDRIATTFVVAFDGTIVEDQRPLFGPISPCALEVLKALKANGNFIVILTSRVAEDREAMLEFLASSDFVPHATITHLPADDLIGENCGLKIQEYAEGLQVDGFLRADYVIDHRQFGITTIQISGDEMHGETFYWIDVVQTLAQYDYLTLADVDNIHAALEEATAQLGD